MRKHIFTSIIITIILILMPVAFASGQEPKTVTDYFLALPNDLFKLVDEGFEYEDPTPGTKVEMDKYRRSKIRVEDIKNGYIQYDHNEFPTEIAIFKKAGGYLMAISVRSLVHANNGQACSGELIFVEYSEGRWVNATERYKPKFNPLEAKKAKKSLFCYELPRKGRTVRLYSLWWDSEETWGYFEWDGEKFIDKPSK